MKQLYEREYLLAGWKLKLDEVSNNVYEIKLLDESLREASTKDHDLERGIRQCAEYAFDIEKQISKNWNKFLFDSAIIELDEINISNKRYDDEVFGSWLIELPNKRILADGKENLIIQQAKNRSEWKDLKSFELKNIEYSQFLSLWLK